MDLSPFKLDIDELIKDFSEGELTTFSDMKRVWLGRKFSYIFEARPSTNHALFMQSLYNHSIGYMNPTNSLSQRLGGLYSLYCLYETQPFKPPFKIYLSLGELRTLKALVVDAKEKGIKVVTAVVKRMVEKRIFLFGFVNINDYSDKERIKELVDGQNACIHKMQKTLFANTKMERYIHMDMGMELDLEALTKMSTEYARNKRLAITEASKVVDVENIKHIAEEKPTIGDEVRHIVEEWSNQKEVFSRTTRSEREQELRQKQLMLLPEIEQRLDEELQTGGFLELIRRDESLEGEANNGKIQRNPEDEQDDEFEYAKDLELQLFEDAP